MSGSLRAVLVATVLLIAGTVDVRAQTPTAWQEGATGLKALSNPDKRTAGLTITVQASGNPALSLQGGVRSGGYGVVAGPSGIELGNLHVQGSIHTLEVESADWAHDELTFSNDLKLTVSRLSPAVLVETQGSSLSLFSGNVGGATSNGGSISNRKPSPSHPKYLAYSSGGVTRVDRLTGERLFLPPLDGSWALLWYGTNSHFVDTKAPISYSPDYGWGAASLPETLTYQADAPMLLTFSSPPTSAEAPAEGGVDIHFSGPAGYVALMPLLGIDHPLAEDTERWSIGLPPDIKSKIDFWSDRLALFPVGVSEDYSYDTATDTATVSETIAYRRIRATGTPFATLPPVLALTIAVGNPLEVKLSGPIADPGYPTEFGPICGIDNTGGYSWSISGLRKYTDQRRVLAGTSEAAKGLQEELTNQVQKLIAAGHLKPWLFSDSLPRSDTRGDIYFLNPADVIRSLVEIAEALPGSSVKDGLIDYIKSERHLFPPESVCNLPDVGTVRAPLALDNYGAWQRARPELFLPRVPLYSFYGISRYYDLTGEEVPPSAMAAAKVALGNDLAEQDWASFSWFRGFELDHTAVVNSSRYMAGMIGFVRLARMVSDADSEDLGRVLLAKAAVQRLALAAYPRYLYSAGQVILPPDGTWQLDSLRQTWIGYIQNHSWTGPYDDPRQTVKLDQFGSYLQDHTGYMYTSRGWDGFVVNPSLSAYRDAVPELFRFLRDYSRLDAQIYLDKVTAYLPTWYVAFSEAALGTEHNLNHPSDSFQLFMAKALLQGDSARSLESYLDVPWLDTGDLFYMQKLAETIRAYDGTVWSDSVR